MSVFPCSACNAFLIPNATLNKQKVVILNISNFLICQKKVKVLIWLFTEAAFEYGTA